MVKKLRRKWDARTSAYVEKYVRGASTLPKVFKQPPGSRLQLIWDDDDNPVAPQKHPSMFKGSIGVIMAKARRYDWTKHWEEQTEDDQEHLWTELKKFWELDESKKNVTLRQIANKQFKDKKSKWKRSHFTPYATYEERMSNKPEQLTAHEWNSLIQHFDSDAHTVVALRNKENCANKVGHHATGRKSFPQIRNEIIEEEGAPANVGDFYVRTRTSLRTNDIVDEASRVYIDKMRDIAGTDENGNPQPITEEIYTQVMPQLRNKRRRRYFAPQIVADESNHIHHVTQLQNELAEMKKKEEERQAEIDEIKKKSQEKDEERQREIDEMKRQFETIEERVMHKLLETVPITHMLNAALSESDTRDTMTHWGQM